MRFVPGLLMLLLVTSCSVKRQVHVSEQTNEIHISRTSRISPATVQQIADARGGKDDGDEWFVDRHRGDIRIKKSRGGSSPDADVELWFRDTDGSWSQRPN